MPRLEQAGVAEDGGEGAAGAEVERVDGPPQPRQELPVPAVHLRGARFIIIIIIIITIIIIIMPPPQPRQELPVTAVHLRARRYAQRTSRWCPRAAQAAGAGLRRFDQ